MIKRSGWTLAPYSLPPFCCTPLFTRHKLTRINMYISHQRRQTTTHSETIKMRQMSEIRTSMKILQENLTSMLADEHTKNTNNAQQDVINSHCQQRRISAYKLCPSFMMATKAPETENVAWHCQLMKPPAYSVLW